MQTLFAIGSTGSESREAAGQSYPDSGLNDHSNQLAERITNPFEFMSTMLPRHPEPALNRAYYKLVELLTLAMPCPAPRRAVCVCEAPGSFLQCIHDIWPACELIGLSGSAITFDPSVAAFSRTIYADMADDATLSETLNPCKGTVDIFTADGACGMDGDKESRNRVLIEAEVKLGLSLLAPGGTLVVKTFGLHNSHALVQSLTDTFGVVYVAKPLGSRPCNRELYLVGVDFKHTQRPHHGPPLRTPIDLTTAMHHIDRRLAASRGVAADCCLVLRDHMCTPVLTAKEIYEHCRESPELQAYVKAAWSTVLQDQPALRALVAL